MEAESFYIYTARRRTVTILQVNVDIGSFVITEWAPGKSIDRKWLKLKKCHII